MRGQDMNADQANRDRRGSFLNNILGIGTGLIGTNLGEGRGPFDFGGGGGGQGSFVDPVFVTQPNLGDTPYPDIPDGRYIGSFPR